MLTEQMQPLTKRQREIFDFVASFLGAKGYAPTLGEIGQEFGMTSLGTVSKHLRLLKAKGYVVRQSHHQRGLSIARGYHQVCPTCGQAWTHGTTEART